VACHSEQVPSRMTHTGELKTRWPWNHHLWQASEAGDSEKEREGEGGRCQINELASLNGSSITREAQRGENLHPARLIARPLPLSLSLYGSQYFSTT